MTARYDEDLAALVIEDRRGDRVAFVAMGQPNATATRVVVEIGERWVSVDLADGLVLLSFLADALGVTLPEVTP